jgi:2-polyprenyl-6-methoxyphenol hydroxylase-like FAD-dependent oxidoreductase
MDRCGIVVAGGGLGGLCAAAGLRKAGIRVVVLERDRTMSSRAQGYRININPVGDAALSQCLPPGHFELYRDTAHRQLDPAVEVFDTGFALLSSRTAENGDSSLPPSAVDRALLRSILADAAGEVRFDSEVVLADATSDGVVVRLSGGRRLHADLLVAADGVGSALRRRLLPSVEPQPLGVTAIYGRAPLSATASSWLPRGVIDQRFLGMTDGSGTTLALGAWNPRRDPAEAARAHVPGIRLSVSDPYIMWVLIGRADRFPSHNADARRLHRFALDATSGWDPVATQFVRDAVIDDTFDITLRAMPAIPVWPTGRITFLGDAIHAMSPAGGEGANTAMADAASLISCFTRSGPGGVAAYERDLRDRATSALRRSANYGRARSEESTSA